MPPAFARVNPGCGRGHQEFDQLTARSIKLATCFSTSGVHSVMAKVTGHIGPSSRLATSLNPKVA